MPIIDKGKTIISRNPEITAYEIAVAEGFVGTKTEWLASLGNDGVVSDTYTNWNAKRLTNSLPIDSAQPIITFKKDSLQNFNFVAVPFLYNVGGDRTLYVNEADSITYKNNSLLGAWIENHYITFD